MKKYLFFVMILINTMTFADKPYYYQYKYHSWLLEIPNNSITKIKNDIYLYSYQAVPDDSDHYKYFGTNIFNTKTKLFQRCASMSTSPYLGIVDANKCVPERITTDGTDIALNNLLKKILNKSCHEYKPSSEILKPKYIVVMTCD